MNTAPVVLVTGASRGIGRGVAVSLAEAGFSVAINYVRNREAADNVAAECRKIGKSDQQVFFPIQADIGQSVDRESLISLVLKRFGRIDALVNNAGIPPAKRVDIVEATEESFDEVIGVNLKGPYFLTQKVVQYWLKDKTEPAIPGG
ncbi:MAG: 3-ketoacyl-ACP reductase, partial [Spirochaetes bacterium]